MVNTFLDIPASLEATNRQHAENAIKVWEDLERYRAVIAESAPEVVIECGTAYGGSAMWFAGQGLRVYTIDVLDRAGAEVKKACGASVSWIIGSSLDQTLIPYLRQETEGKRVMVVLDSLHYYAHVAQEIELYKNLVTPGCFMVVEDGIVEWMPGEGPGPLSVLELLEVDPDWQRALKIEKMHPVTMHPAGFWRRKK